MKSSKPPVIAAANRFARGASDPDEPSSFKKRKPTVRRTPSVDRDRVLRQAAETSIDMRFLLDERLKSTDHRGHPKRLNIDVPPDFAAELQRFVEHSGWGFDSVAEFLRTSGLAVMDFLEQLDPPQYISNVQLLKAISSENAASAMRRKYLENIDETATEVFELLGMGLQSEAIRLVSKTIDYVRRLDPANPFKSVYEDAIKRKFGGLLKKGKIISLLADVGDTE